MTIDVDIGALAKSHWVAGFFGGLVALRFAPGLSWFERGFNVACGGLCAGFFSPALAEWLKIDSANMQSALAFLVGMFGLSMAAAIVDGIRGLKLAEIATKWLSRGG